MFGKRKLERELQELRDDYDELYDDWLDAMNEADEYARAAGFWRQLFFERHGSDIH